MTRHDPLPAPLRIILLVIGVSVVSLLVLVVNHAAVSIIGMVIVTLAVLSWLLLELSRPDWTRP